MATNNAIDTENPIQVAKGGTGKPSLTAYAVVCGGTTATGDLQSIASVGSSGEVLISNGSSALPTFQDLTSIFPPFSSDPSSPSAGDAWYNTTDDDFKGAIQAFVWVSAGSLNTARYGLWGAGDYDDGLSFGGYTGSTNSAVTERYSSGSDTWTSKTSLNTARRYIAGAGTASSAVSFGGYTTGFVGTTELYDGTGDTWTAKTAMNTSRSELSGCGTASDALSMAGNAGFPSNQTAVERYDLTGDSWTNKSGVSTARRDPGGTSTAATALCYGGYTTGSVGTTELYDGGGDSWTSKTSRTTAVYGPGGGGDTNTSNNLTCAGYDTGGASYSLTTEIFDVSGNSWSSGDDVSAGRLNAGMCGGVAGALYFGGNNSGAQSSTERYELGVGIVTFTVT